MLKPGEAQATGEGASTDCIVLLGGAFDPVHAGHVAIAGHFCSLFQTRDLRLVPAGNPWQKARLQATPDQRIDMLRLAFFPTPLSVTIDTREIEHAGPTYTVDTLKAVRRETGGAVSLVFTLGSDQLLNLNTWHEWEHLFDFAHIAVALRPGYAVTPPDIPPGVRETFFSRLAPPHQIRNTPGGLTHLTEGPAIDISAAEIRKSVRNPGTHHPLVPPEVLDYIVKHNLYRD